MVNSHAGVRIPEPAFKALWCNWLTHRPVTAKSTGSIPVRVVKDKIDLDYGYTMPDIYIYQDTVRQTVSYNWNAEKHMEKVLSELHNIKDEEL